MMQDPGQKYRIYQHLEVFGKSVLSLHDLLQFWISGCSSENASNKHLPMHRKLQELAQEPFTNSMSPCVRCREEVLQKLSLRRR